MALALSKAQASVPELLDPSTTIPCETVSIAWSSAALIPLTLTSPLPSVTIATVSLVAETPVTEPVTSSEVSTSATAKEPLAVSGASASVRSAWFETRNPSLSKVLSRLPSAL